MTSSSSSNHSTIIPLSFDRFRVRSIQFLSPFRNHQCAKRNKQSPERSRIRKIQVHPNNINSSKSDQIDNDAAYLFHANKRSNSKSSLTENSQNKKCTNNLFNTQLTSNIVGVFDMRKLPVTNASRPSQYERTYTPTPCMIGYRCSSLPNLIPTRVIKRPKLINDSIKQYNFDTFEQFNAE